MLIVGAYADGIQATDAGGGAITRLSAVLGSVLPNTVAVHLLPFYPTSGDFGFAIDDWLTVRHELGTWADIRDLASTRQLIVDGVYNHVGIGHRWVRDFMSNPGLGSSRIHAYKVSPQVTGPMSPRGQPVLRPCDVGGRRWYLWHTFTDWAVDIRLDNELVLSEVDRHLATLAMNGIWAVRLDAVAYYAKFPGSAIRHNPGVFALADRIASMVEAHGMRVIAQLDCDDAGLQYYSGPSQAHYVLNDFSYSAYLALALLTRDPNPLAAHLLATSGAAHPYIRTPRNHDGILLRSGNLSPDSVSRVIDAAAGVGIATRFSGDLPYELNCSAPCLYTRVAPRSDLASVVELTTAVTGMTDGWSYFYLPSILGYVPEDEGSIHSDPRAVNRLPIPASVVSSFVDSARCKRLWTLLEALSTVHASGNPANRASDSMPTADAQGTVLRLTPPGGEYHLAANFGDAPARMPLRVDEEVLFHGGYSRAVLKPRGYVIWRSTPLYHPTNTAGRFRNDHSHEIITSIEHGSREGGPHMLVLALDIGGSSVKHGVVHVNSDGSATLNRADTEPLPTLHFADLQPLVIRVVEAYLKDEPNIKAVGISTTGSVDRMGIVVSAGHFEGYKNISWRSLLVTAFPQLTRVVTVNDGRASAWAEYAASAGAHGSHIHAVVGTGVGGGIVYDGDLVLGDSGQAGYLGHIKVTDGPTATCSCGSTGCVEALAAAPAILRNFNKEEPSRSTTSPVDSLPAVAAAAESGDEVAVEAFRRAGYWLGVGLGDAMNVLNPSLVTVGGGVLVASEGIANAGDGGPYFSGISDGVSQAAHKRVFASARLGVARFGNDGGLIGAARLAAREEAAAS